MYKFKNVHVIISDGGENFVDQFTITDKFKGHTFRDFTAMAKEINNYFKTDAWEGNVYAGYEKIRKNTLESIIPVSEYEGISNKECLAYVTMEYENANN